MPSITIRDVPEETRRELASRAALSGRSLQEFLRMELIGLAAMPSIEALLQRVEQRKTSDAVTVSADEILAARDADRR